MRTGWKIWIVWWIGCLMAAGAELDARFVAVLYNSADPESRELAEYYREARSIPEENLLGLPMPRQQDITREQYEESIRKPLAEAYGERGWWRMGEDAAGTVLPVANRMPVVAVMRGVPMRVRAQPKPEGFQANPDDPVSHRDEASVDSELVLAGIESVAPHGATPNHFFRNEAGYLQAGLPFLLLTSRIDAASLETCKRMIRDAIEAERRGLWGRAYVDVANKFPLGDDWLETIAEATREAGIPTVVDRFNDTLPRNYPMSDAALYYGWYDANVSGPFLNPAFRLRPGAVALHIHSFSAQQLRDPTKNWSAPLLEKGAAVTVGNVYEPYLQISHHFDIVHDRLARGWTWVEASWAGMPATSWQSVALGDPLYRPFLRLDGSGEVEAADRDFRALRMAALEWGDDPAEWRRQLIAAAGRTGSGNFYEALGLEALANEREGEAQEWFRQARDAYDRADDRLRQDFHLISVERAAGRRGMAVQLLQNARQRHGGTPGEDALRAWLDILDPPPPGAAGGQAPGR